MFFVKNFKVLIISWFVVGFLLAPAAAVQQGKVYGNCAFPRLAPRRTRNIWG